MDDPIEKSPTHVLRWERGSWWLLSSDRKVELGRKPKVEDLHRLLSSSDSEETRLFTQLPVPCTLRRHLQLGKGTVNDAVELVTDSAQAVYVLAGRLQDGALAYSWIRPGVLAGDEEISSLPLSTRWLTLDDGDSGAQNLGRALQDLALRIAKVRAWLTLEPPRPSVLPYRLALRHEATGRLKLGDQLHAGSADGTFPRDQDHRHLVEGERYGLMLVADPHEVQGRTIEQRYTYVLLIDCHGGSTLLFPRPEHGSVENHLPLPSPHDASYPSEIELGPQPSLLVSEPWGIDTYLLLTSKEPIPDPFVVEARDVRGMKRGIKHPLEWLLRNHGSSTRGPSDPLPTTWSIERVTYEAVTR